VSRTMSCDSVETRMRIRPRESSLSLPFAAASVVPLIAGVKRLNTVARSSLERRSRTACDRTSRRTQQVIDQRCVRPAFCQRHFDYGHPRFVRRFAGAVPLRGPANAWRVSRRPTHFGCVDRAFRGGRSLPATWTELTSSDAPVTALRLSSRLHACAYRAFAPRKETPAHRSEEASASARPRPPAHDDP
jgi:hypothetical protein